jgi:hypothetical protein
MNEMGKTQEVMKIKMACKASHLLSAISPAVFFTACQGAEEMEG